MIAIVIAVGEPVSLLKLAGAIEAAHIPVVTGLVLYLDLRTLPKDLRPSAPVVAMTALAGLFFAGFAGYYLYDLATGGGG